MSSGYTPVFNSALDGTLYGRWPQTGVWLCLLSQCDRYGRIDMVPRLLAAKIGVPENVLLACIHDFMEPDPGSRTGDLEGRRLELLDPVNRNWGWRVVNHGLYRERARKSAYDAERTQSGADAERKRKEREEHVKDAVPRPPGVSRNVPLSDANANANANANASSNKNTERASERLSGSVIGNFELTQERKAVAEARKLDAELTHLKFVAHHKSKGTRNADWDGAWQKWCLDENANHCTSTVKRCVAKSTAELEAEEAKQREAIAKVRAEFPDELLSHEAIERMTLIPAEKIRELERDDRGTLQ